VVLVAVSAAVVVVVAAAPAVAVVVVVVVVIVAAAAVGLPRQNCVNMPFKTINGMETKEQSSLNLRQYDIYTES
jgi:O-antigen ligase